MKPFLFFAFTVLLGYSAQADVGAACRGERSCFSALNGEERKFCEAYKENKSCFMALDGEDRGWCSVITEGKSCFMALNGRARRRCENGRFPGKHVFWARCGGKTLPDNGGSSPRQRACRGESSCFMALDGLERKLCQAYKENSSCFMALDGEHRGWCKVLKEGSSCFMALNGRAREKCEDGIFPGQHLFWQGCGDR